ncbi:MAG: UbiA prenyltransferase family protein [Candidatus Nealsonbacteria bacterium]
MEAILRTYFKLLRVPDWGGYFLMGLLGFVLSYGFLFPLSDIFLFFSMLVLFLGLGFSVNECFDLEEDKYNKEKTNILLKKQIGFREALIFSIVLGVSGLVLSIKFGLKVFLFCLMGLLIGFFYSAKPFRFKSRPFLDLISHGLFAGVFLFLLPFLVFNAKITLIHYLIAFSVFYLSLSLELRNHLEDYEFDKKAGINTSVCFLGYNKSEKLLRYLAFLYPLAFLPIFLLVPRIYFFLFLILSAAFLLFFSLRKNYTMLRKYKIMDIYSILSFVLISISLIL